MTLTSTLPSQNIRCYYELIIRISREYHSVVLMDSSDANSTNGLIYKRSESAMQTKKFVMQAWRCSPLHDLAQSILYY
jgi:hypothetical protein